nr:alpha/beta hydrolase [Glycomyces sp. L485]
MAASLLAGAPAAAETENTLLPGYGIDWAPCPDVEPEEEVDCATIKVPLDYRRPWGEKIEIGLARRQATNPHERIGTILMDPGGPGGSGVSTIEAFNPLTEAAAERFDIVGFDPRGVNTSTRVQCGADAVDAVDAIGIPTDQESFEALEAANANLTADCRERTGRLFDHVDNLHTVEDIERIRRALGEGRLNYLGYSYGTLMGQQYAEKYPWFIRTMVLDGNMDHSLESTWDFVSTETAAVEENFVTFAAWCESTPECELYGEDVAALYGELKEAARAGELTDPLTGEPLDFYGLSAQVFQANIPEGWSSLAIILRAMHDGEMLPPSFDIRQEEIVEYPYYPMWCQDWGYEIADYAEFEELTGKLAAEYPNVEWTPYNAHALTCAGSGIENTNPRAELDVDFAPPLVFIGTVHDPATVYPWTEASAEQAGGHLITYEGYGHTIYGRHSSPCVNEAVDAYFVYRAAPEDGLSCENLNFPGDSTLLNDRDPLNVGPF